MPRFRYDIDCGEDRGVYDKQEAINVRLSLIEKRGREASKRLQDRDGTSSGLTRGRVVVKKNQSFLLPLKMLQQPHPMYINTKMNDWFNKEYLFRPAPKHLFEVAAKMLFDVPGLRWINQEARDAMTEEVAFSVDEREILAKDSERRVAIIKVVLLQSGVLTDKANTSGLSAQNLLERTFKLRDRFLNALGWSPDQPLGGINSRLLRRHQYRVRVGENSKSPLDFPKDAGVPTSVSLRSKERKHRAQTPERRGRMKRFKGTIRDSEDEDELRMVIDDPFY